MPLPRLDPSRTLFFLCDIQTIFRPSIYGYDKVISTANKLVDLAKIFQCEVLCTTQNARGLGPIDPAIDLSQLGPELLIGTFDKTMFSMLTVDVLAALDARPHIDSIVLFGIESHICILQTALALLAHPRKFTPHLAADGVSSCNLFEVPLALASLRQEGAVISTSESIAFQLMHDASLPGFRAFSAYIRRGKEHTREAGEVLIEGVRSQSRNIKDHEICKSGL